MNDVAVTILAIFIIGVVFAVARYTPSHNLSYNKAQDCADLLHQLERSELRGDALEKELSECLARVEKARQAEIDLLKAEIASLRQSPPPYPPKRTPSPRVKSVLYDMFSERLQAADITIVASLLEIELASPATRAERAVALLETATETGKRGELFGWLQANRPDLYRDIFSALMDQ